MNSLIDDKSMVFYLRKLPRGGTRAIQARQTVQPRTGRTALKKFLLLGLVHCACAQYPLHPAFLDPAIFDDHDSSPKS